MEGTTTGAVSSGDAGSAPTTIGDAGAALAFADSSTASPETPDSSAPPPAAAIAQPDAVGEVPAPTTDAKKGEPPAWRWQDILENTRVSVAKETEERIRKEVEQQYAGLNDFTQLAPHERAGLALWNRALNGDPAARAEVSRQAQANPQLAQALKGFMATEPQAQNVEPEPDLQTADGQLVYSAPQLKQWQQWNANQLRSEFEKKLQPIVTEHQQTISERQLSSYKMTTSDAINGLKAKYPEFDAHKSDVAAVIQADKMLTSLAANPETAALALTHAWQQVYLSKVLPAKQSQTEAQVVASLQQRAVAATTNPASATSATPKQTLGDARAALEHATAQLGA
jgi:hypothetical protein